MNHLKVYIQGLALGLIEDLFDKDLSYIDELLLSFVFERFPKTFFVRSNIYDWCAFQAFILKNALIIVAFKS